MIHLYEQNHLPVDEKLIIQYLQNPKIAKEFAVYYDLFNKYRSDYQVDKILAGKATKAIRQRASAAKFDERLSLLVCCWTPPPRAALRGGAGGDAAGAAWHPEGRESRPDRAGGGSRRSAGGTAAPSEDPHRHRRRSGSLSQEAERSHRRIIAALERQKALAGQTVDSQTGFAAVKADFDQMVQGLKAQAKTAGEMLNNLFAFCEEVFPEGQELLILVTELTINYYAATFISRYGCDAYFTHNQELLFYERQQEIISQLESLELN